ncbi:MAG TPA: DUF3240 domain-containing protein [Gammaproteobacteria bacterium]|nr:DUF3240 domain-containing protein [Gammaproteobacteria bacterium]
MNTQQTLLSIIVSPSLEEGMVDWLLAADEVSGFTSIPVNGHGNTIHSMSLAEQVAGSRRKILFQTHLPQPQALQLVEKLKGDFTNCGVHYWLTPLLAAGPLT